MTIIATDGKSMVGDGRRTWGTEIIAENDVKMIRHEDRIFGYSGPHCMMIPVFEWAKKTNYDIATMPDVENNPWHVLELNTFGVWRITSEVPYLGSYPAPMAIGMGVDLAIGAMLAGKTAREAVEIVVPRIGLCGGLITELFL
jgi:hypothetical protein